MGKLFLTGIVPYVGTISGRIMVVPRSGIVADIRARTRASYHNIIKSVKRNENNIRACNMAKSFFNIDKRNIWTEIKKLIGKT